MENSADLQENEMESRQSKANRANCEECGKNHWKYKCPGCGLRSCGLPCVTAHKGRTQCTGKRNRSMFVPLSQFDENWLVSDYNLLEEVLRMTEAAKRSRASLGDSRRFLSRPMKSIQTQARNRNTNLLFLPKGMSKNQTNRSHYHTMRKCIYWTVEWQFHSTDVIFIDHRVDEHVSLQSILEKHLTIGPGNPMIRHKLRHFCKESTENLKFFVKKEYTKGTKTLYFELNITEPLRSQLAHKTIIEYPVIHVVLPAHEIGFEVFIDLHPVPKKDVKPSTVDKMGDRNLDDLVHLEGVPFREEEIKEVEFERFRDVDPVPKKVGKPSLSAIDKFEDQNLDDLVHQGGAPFREGAMKEGEFKGFRNVGPIPKKVGKPSAVDKMEDQNVDDLVHQEGLSFRKKEIDGGEFEVFRDLDPVLKKVVKLSTKLQYPNPDDHVHREGVSFMEEEIEEGEFEVFRDLDLFTEKVVNLSTVDKMEDQNLVDLVHREGVPFSEEEIKEGDFEIFRDLYTVPEKNVNPATVEEMEDQNLNGLVHLESKDGECFPNWDFDEDYICR